MTKVLPLVVLSLALQAAAATSDAVTLPGCLHPNQQFVSCVNSTHYTLRSCNGNAEERHSTAGASNVHTSTGSNVHTSTKSNAHTPTEFSDVVAACPVTYRCVSYSKSGRTEGDGIGNVFLPSTAGSCVFVSSDRDTDSNANLNYSSDPKSMMAAHLPRTISLQRGYSTDAAELLTCSGGGDNPQSDAIEGKILCEALDVAIATQPTFAHNTANTWVNRPSLGPGSVFGCNYTNASEVGLLLLRVL